MFQLIIFSEFLPLVFYSIFYKKLTNKALKVFFYYTLILAVFSIVTYLLTFKSPLLNLQIVKIFSLLEFIVLTFFFLKFIHRKVLRRIVYFASIVFLSFFVFDLFQIKKIPTNSLIFEFLFFIVVIVFFLFQRMNDIVSIPISSTISFWIAVALLIYFSGNFFNILLTKLSLDPKIRAQSGMIYMIVTISKNILLCLALLGSEKNEITDENIPFPNDEGFQKLDISNN